MAVNFPDSPSNGDTFTSGSTTYTFNSTKGIWKAAIDSTAQALDGLTDVDLASANTQNGQTLVYNSTAQKFVANTIAAGVTVYSALSDLPLAGQDDGTMAFVSGTNRLYIWNSSGWYNIALVNTSPSISGASGTYALNTNGSNTVVTLVASDPEGIPITFTATHSGLGVGANVIATVTQSNNIFTFTPTTNTSLAGTFTTTFTASDGVNLATANSSFTLSFVVNNSRYTTALITSVGGNNADNNDFVDSSTGARTITATGDVTQNTFSPYRRGGYSVYCDGNDAVKFNETGSDEFTFGTGDFTLEGWFWIDLASIGASGEHTLIGNNGTDTELWFSVIGSTWGGPKYNFQTGTGSGWNTTVSSGSNTVTLREWVHLAVVRNSGTVTIYENGVSVASGSNTDNIPNTNNMLSFMGRPQTYGQYATGYIHDVRITKGEAVYTSAFTPPTEKLTAGSNTKLLAFRNPQLTDESSSPLSVTLDTGDPTVEPFAPYDYAEYESSSHGGSIYYDGSGDYLSVPSSADFNVSSGAWTVEAWVRSNTWSDHQHVFSAYSDNSNRSSLYYNSTSSNITYWSNGSARIEGGSLNANQWYHLALSSDGTTTTLYINGVSAGTTTHTQSNANMAIYAGTAWTSGAPESTGYMDGYISNFRFVKGTAVYTGAFTPPTAPLTAVTNTKLLLSGTNAAIIDRSQSVKSITLNGDTKSSTTQTKYLSSSMYFDGTGDNLQIDGGSDFTFPGDFTAECWIYCTATTNDYAGILGFSHDSQSTGWNILVRSNGKFHFNVGMTYTDATGSVSTNQWTHLALVRSGTGSNNCKLYINGVADATTITKSGIVTQPTFVQIGGYPGISARAYTGYISDVRITKGLARYTSNFTVPSAALTG